MERCRLSLNFVINYLKLLLNIDCEMLSQSFVKASKILPLFLNYQLRSYFLKPHKQPHHDLIMIRHAQSTFNKACEDYRQLHKIPYIWKELCNHEGFDQKILFNLNYIDCPITDIGISECKKTQNLLKYEQIDCLLVSPQLRALQTCSYIFQNFKKPVIVQPLLVGPLRSCCDVNMPTEQKKTLFPEYDFSRTEDYSQFWYLDYLPQDQLDICKERFALKNLDTFQKQRSELVNLLREGKIYEGPRQYRNRIQKAKQKIVEYKQSFPKIGIVTHYYTIEYLSAKNYMSCGTPVYYIDVKNCQPYYASLKELLSIKEQEISPTNKGSDMFNKSNIKTES